MDGRNNDRRKPDQDLHGPENLILSVTYIWIDLTISISNAISPQRSPRFFTWQELNWLPVSFRGWHLTRCKGMGEIDNDGPDQDSDPGYQNLLSGVLRTELSRYGNQAGLSHYSPLNGLNGHRSWRSPQAHSLAGVNLSVWGMGITSNVTRWKK